MNSLLKPDRMSISTYQRGEMIPRRRKKSRAWRGEEALKKDEWWENRVEYLENPSSDYYTHASATLLVDCVTFTRRFFSRETRRTGIRCKAIMYVHTFFNVTMSLP